MKVTFYKTIKFLNNYKNFGQNAEQSAKFVLTGEIRKADNIPCWVDTDCLHYQIKAERGSICLGTTAEDLLHHLRMDKADEYMYICKNGNTYILDKEAYFEFVMTFAEFTTDSTKNGGKPKMRFGRRFTEINKWLFEKSF